VTSFELLALSLAVAVLWCLVLASAGSRARRIARLPVGVDLRLSIDFLLGSWIFAMAALLCGLAGEFRPAPLLLCGGVLAVLGRWRARGWRLASILPPLAAAAVLVPVALAPPFFHDALVYHLGLPWQALKEGRLSPHAEDLFASFPPLAQLVFAGPLAAGCDRVPALLHLAAFLVAGAAIEALALRLDAPPTLARLAGAALPVLPALALVPGLPAAEGWTLVPLLAGLAVAIEGRGSRLPRPGPHGSGATDRPRDDGDPADRGRAVLAGFLAGVASAARLQGIPWAGIIIAVATWRARRRLRGAVLAACACLVGSAPWWLKNLVLLHDPLAPLLWRREGIETLWRDASSLGLREAGMAGWLQALPPVLLPHLAYLGPLALSALLGVLVRRDGRLWLLGCAAILGIVAWSLTGSLPRFLAPTLALLLVLAAAAGHGGRARFLAAALAIGTCVLLGLAFTFGQVERRGGAGLALSRPEAWRSDLVINNPAPAYAAARDLPPDAHVLFVGETRGFAFPRRFTASSQHDVSPLRDPIESLPSADRVRDRLVASGFTHLLVNRGELLRLSRRYPVAPWRSPAGQERFQELLSLLTPPVLVQGEIAVFALARP